MGIRLYCGLGEKQWNHHPIELGSYACVSPVVGASERTHTVNRVAVPSGVSVYQDSGAFNDGPAHRLEFGEALERQIAHAERFHYAKYITGRASYDLLIDERWMSGVRSKLRWDPADAEFASKTSIAAAQFLTRHENRQGLRLILSAQGVTPEQYLWCAQQIVESMEYGDIFGLGGWCILGKIHSLVPLFKTTMSLVIPFLAREGVCKVHIWGVCYPPALRILLGLCNEYGLLLSTDSAGPAVKPVMGKWGYGDWCDKTYTRPPVLETCRTGEHHLCVGCRGLERIRHVLLTRQWLESFVA